MDESISVLKLKLIAIVVTVFILSVTASCNISKYTMLEMVKAGADPIMVGCMFSQTYANTEAYCASYNAMVTK